ncbi:hypothetical protein HanRHA438_Chr17g0825331 [Helianthus annuus]|nr:hypothetical protein HanRHA438_Chr17g0825331 [Helianthus annuus]
MVAEYCGTRVSEFGGNSTDCPDRRIFGDKDFSNQQGILGPGPTLVFDQTFSPGLQSSSQNLAGSVLFDNQFGPSNVAQWAGYSSGPHFGSSKPSQQNIGSNGQSSTSFRPNGPQFGLMADLSRICDHVDSWVPDSGATAHMTVDSSRVAGVVPYTGIERVIVGNGTSLTISHIGYAYFIYLVKLFYLNMFL